MATATQTAELFLSPPDYVLYGPDRTRCGGVVYRALRHLLAHPDTTTDAFAKGVWGDNVQTETLKSALYRLNCLLKGLGCQMRGSLDGDRVLFL